jgi:plasmid stabilization system protein ParE
VSIHGYLRENASAASADRVRAHLRQRIMRLGKFPYIGTTTTQSGIRILAPTRYPCRIYYTIADGAVVILHIRHTSRQAPDLDELG